MKRTILTLLFMLVASVFVISNANPGVGEIKADVGETSLSVLSGDVLLYNQQYIQIQSVVICDHFNNPVVYGVIVTVNVDVQGGHSPPTTTLHTLYTKIKVKEHFDLQSYQAWTHRMSNTLIIASFV